MASETPEGFARPAAVPWVQNVSANADAASVADAFETTWTEIDAALSPIVGKRGVAALYARTLLLCGPGRPWRHLTHDGLQPVDLTALKAVLSQQSAADADEGCRAFLKTFRELLTSLVGAQLTERLLHAAWAPPSLRGPAPQDTAPQDTAPP